MRAGGVFRRRDGSGRTRLTTAASARLEAETSRLVRRGSAAARAGSHDAAADARRAAADTLRAAPGADGALGAILCDLADSLLRLGAPDEAVAALDEAEEAYGRPADRAADRAADRITDRIAGVQARRATAYGLAGAGASAIVDAQSAVVHHRDRAGGDPGDPRQRDRTRGLARALAANADVLAAYGDPDLAVASADLAVRLQLAAAAAARTDAEVEQLRAALTVAVAVHTAHGRHDLADQAGTLARRIGGLAGPGAPTVLGARQRSRHPPVLAITVASALDAACRRFGRQPPRVGDRAVVRPAVDVELVVPLDRVLIPPGGGARSADAAARLGGTLTGLAAELLPVDPARGARLGLEAHALLAGASRLESELLRYQLQALGPPWAAVLLAGSRRAEADRDPALALDLAAWAGGVAEQLFPATLVDREARTVAVEVLDHHGRLLAEHGESGRARDASRTAARLRSMSPS